MREYTSIQEDPLRNLISTTALLLLSSVITETTAFSLKHEALLPISKTKGAHSDSAEAVAAVTGLSTPLIDKAMSLFDPGDGVVQKWPLSSGKIFAPPEHFLPFKPFLPPPMQSYGFPPQYKPPPNGSNDKDQGVYAPKPPDVPAPIQVTVQESQTIGPVDPDAALEEPTPPLEFSSGVIEPVILETHAPNNLENSYSSSDSPPLELTHFIPSPYGWKPNPNAFPSSGPSQHISLSVKGNIADIITSNNVNMQVSTDGEGDSYKHFLGLSKPSSMNEKTNSSKKQ